VVTVLFACVQNAGRSQMAAALFSAVADPARARAVSAGTKPGPRVHPEVVDVLREVGIDLTGVTPRPLTDELARGASVLVTMGCGEDCPVVPGARRIDWSIADPKGLPVEQVRRIREEIRAKVERLVAELRLDRSGKSGSS
jgi:arsenate reductase (thioredoxin)